MAGVPAEPRGLASLGMRPMPDFFGAVLSDHDLVVTSAHEHAWRLAPRQSDLAWYCDLDDGTPTGESDPASFVRWVCPSLPAGGPAMGREAPVVNVSRAGPGSDLGRLVRRFAKLAGRSSGADADGRFVYTDPLGILDTELRQRIESWPSAMHGDGVLRPAELWSISVTSEGLVVESASWWDSAAALGHQIDLALDIAHRLEARRPEAP